MAEFVTIAQASDIPLGEGRSLRCGKEDIALFHCEDGFYAIEDFCTHAGAPLGNGFVEGHRVACAWHGAEFCLKTGEALTPPAFGQVKAYEVRVQGTAVQILPQQEQT
ncbi:MAG TPA: ferredoxin [Lentisphaeria bacterium]|jgi:3-phenylpropionate/trans-cinnamate dioxygenase ferredoxin subunit|nr:ferredoxin [Lentisphaeria bacterium]